jgi:LysM repeat protein
MPGVIGTNKTRQKQIFRQLSDKPVNAGDYRFFPWAAPPTKTRDAAPAPNTINTHIAGKYSLTDIVAACADIGSRISALEMRKARQQQLADQLALQQRSTQTQFEQPTHQPTQDRACACQHQPAPHALYRDGVTTMDTSRHPGLAPNRNIKFGCFPNPRMLEGKTRDQNNIESNYLEKPSRFSSQEADRMANYLPPGSAGRVSNKEAVNDINLRVMRDAGHQYNISGQPQPAMTQGSDLSSAFASELQAIPSGQPNAAMNVLHKYHNAAKDGATRDAIERVWRDFMSSYDARGDSPWKPRQAEVHDAPWSNLYSQNQSVIGGNPDRISPGMQLSMPGGGTHTVQSGETLSSIAATPSGTDLGSKSLSAERGGMESTPAPSGSYSSGGTLKSSEGAPAGAPGAHNAANVPTPPTKPSDLSESPSSSSSGETPTPPVKPASLGGTGESPEGLNPQAGEGGGASPTGSEGTGLAKMVRGWVTGETQ